MDFFKTVFADDPEPPRSEPESKSPNNEQRESDTDPKSVPDQPESNPTEGGSGGGGAWSFGGLIRTLTTKSESVIETYRRDLKEFGVGLRKEIEVAHGSLETVGHTIDEIGSSVLKNNAQIISQSKEAILAGDPESDSSDNNNERNIGSQQSLNSVRYSRFDAQVRAIQGDASTYCEEPEDLDDYMKWKTGFVLEEKREEIEGLIEENGSMVSIYKKVVPSDVDEETFWCRYYYRVHKLKQAEDLRVNLVKRAISTEEEDLTWDVDDDEEEEEEEEEEKVKEEKENAGLKANLKESEDLGGTGLTESSEIKEEVSREVERSVENKKRGSEESEQIIKVNEEEKSLEDGKGEKKLSGGDSMGNEKELEKSKEDNSSQSDEKLNLERKADSGQSSKDGEFSVTWSHPAAPEEEDFGWDEIEDLSAIDEKKVSHSGSEKKVDLRKQINAAEDDEDLTWDIEDDDEEAVKA